MKIFAIAVLIAVCFPVSASDLLPVKQMKLELANTIAMKAVQECRKMGYQVSAVVVDRSGIPQVVARDVLASRFTIQLAEDKANAVVLSGISSGEFRANRKDIREEMNHVDGVLLLQGGLPINAAGSLVGALGVSGAAGGDKDEACAQKALDTVRERLEFAE